jgi:hypothetical protein
MKVNKSIKKIKRDGVNIEYRIIDTTKVIKKLRKADRVLIDAL